MDHTTKLLNELRSNAIVEDYLRRYHDGLMEAGRLEREELEAVARRSLMKIAA